MNQFALKILECRRLAKASSDSLEKSVYEAMAAEFVIKKMSHDKESVHSGLEGNNVFVLRQQAPDIIR